MSSAGRSYSREAREWPLARTICRSRSRSCKRRFNNTRTARVTLSPSRAATIDLSATVADRKLPIFLQNDFAPRPGEWACDQVHTITAKTGYHSVDQRLRPMARFPMNIAIGKTKIRCCARLRGYYIPARVTRTAASAGDRVCQRRVAGLVGDRSRAFRGP